MALIQRLERSSKGHHQLHEPVPCTYTNFPDPETGEPVLQLDTFGRPGRDMPNKISQSVQFNRESAAELKRIIEQVFGL